jgi:hypothetical protein
VLLVGFEFKGLGPCGFVWVSFCGFVWLFLCILPMYLEVSYAFLIKPFLLIKKKKKIVDFFLF